MKNHRKHFDRWDMIGMHVPAGRVDDNGKVLTEDWVDGGDSCHFMGIFFYLYFAHDSLRHRDCFEGYMDLRFFQAEHLLLADSFFGGYKIHPDSRYWYGANNVMSRDQMTPMLCAMAIAEDRPGLLRQLKYHVRRLLLFTTNTRKNGSSAANHGQKFSKRAQSLSSWEKFVLKYKIPFFSIKDGYRNYNWKLPDLTLFDIWSIYIRGLRAKWLYPILLLGDLQLLINGLLILRNKEDRDVANWFLKHSLSRRVMPTFLSAFTQKYILPKTKLSMRVAFNYIREGMPQFLGLALREAIQEQEKQ